MYNKSAPFNTVFILKTSQSYITAVKKALDNRKALNLEEVQFRLGMIIESLQLGIDRINELTQSQEQAQTSLREGSRQSSELMADIANFAQGDIDLSASEVSGIAKDLHQTAEKLHLLLSAGVNPQ